MKLILMAFMWVIPWYRAATRSTWSSRPDGYGHDAAQHDAFTFIAIGEKLFSGLVTGLYRAGQRTPVSYRYTDHSSF